MSMIFTSREDAQKNIAANSVLISAQLRNPVRYPSVWIPANVFSNLANAPEQYRELLRAILTERIEAIIRDAVRDNKTSIDSTSITEENLLASAAAKASTKLSKEEYMAQFWLSALGLRVRAMARTNPAMAKQMEDSIASCASPRAASSLSETRTAQLLTVLSKPDYATDSDSQWYLQALASIETAAAKRSGSDLDSVF